MTEPGFVREVAGLTTVSASLRRTLPVEATCPLSEASDWWGIALGRRWDDWPTTRPSCTPIRSSGSFMILALARSVDRTPRSRSTKSRAPFGYPPRSRATRAGSWPADTWPWRGEVAEDTPTTLPRRASCMSNHQEDVALRLSPIRRAAVGGCAAASSHKLQAHRRPKHKQPTA